ncbi:sensor histidine kinase [Geothrix sp. 21YS21S-4]|uniref:sensor histidine kinase n=1 Tax=Geothrix sp. 21YS21S-4 TaxID=3068889 RepID=UPI0027BA71F5|nr:sensor histidine kinase [Geothrix sp. 21YS21S-4]
MGPRTAGTRLSLRRAARWLVWLLPWLWIGGAALALDPARPLATCAQRAWRSEDGLLQDTVEALAETEDGFLWIGTGAGLVRFDGAAFEPYSRLNVPGFSSNAVKCLAEGPGDAVWIGTSEPGLYLLDRGALRAFGAAEGLPDRPIRRLLKDRAGTLWAAPTEGPLLRFDGTAFRPVPCDAAQLRIRALAEDETGAIWAVAGTGLWRLQQDRLLMAAVGSAELTAVSAGGQGEVWAGTTSGGIFKLEAGRLEPVPWARGLPSKAVSLLRVDRRGSLWVGFEQGGLFRRTVEGRLEAVPAAGGSRATPLCLLEDRAGALWTGSETRGLSALYPVPFHSLPVAGSEAEETVLMVCQDVRGDVWGLTRDHALAQIRGGRVERLRPAPSLGGVPSALWPRAAGGVWVGTSLGGLNILEEGRTRPFHWPDGTQPDAIVALYEDPNRVLWVASARQGLVRLPPDGSPVIHPAIQGVQAFAGGGPGPLFLADPNRGLGILESGRTRWLGRAEGLGSSGVRCLHLDGDGTLWVGTADGLRRYRNGAFQAFEGQGGPAALPIHALGEDAEHRLWAGTPRGVFRILPPEGEGPLAAALYDHHDGLPSREAQPEPQPTSWITREGELYLSTSRGLARLAPKTDLSPEPALRIQLLKAEGDDALLPAGPLLRVPAGTHRFELHYTAPSLLRADKVRFRYRLEGWERAWNEVGDRRFATYSNLPAGSYRFVLQGWRGDERGEPAEQSVDVVVLPLFYQRAAFWGLCALLLAAFAAWLVRLRIQQAEARTAVLAERNRMAREIHDHLAQGFTGVLLQLEAAEAKLGRLAGDPEPVLTRLDHARQLAVASLQEARRSVMTLQPRRPEGMDLLGALRSLSDRLLAGTEIQVELAQTGEPRPLGPRLEEELLRMAQEALTNALRHGHARWVRVVLQYEGRQVRLHMEDDGQGFDPSANAAGYGMRSIRESVRQWRGRIDVDSGPGLGTRITITLPIPRWRS